MGLIKIPGEVFVAFGLDKSCSMVRPFGSGHIHQTFRVDTDNQCFIFQCINHKVFPDVAALMDNIFKVTRYISKNSSPEDLTVRIIQTLEGKSFYHDDQGQYWRVMERVPNSKTYDMALSPSMAFEAGKVLGDFHYLLKDFPVEQLHTILPNFHNLDSRWREFLIAKGKASTHRLSQANALIQIVDIACDDELIFSRKIYSPHTRKRIVHNDPKINNVLFDNHLRGICMIDLDTMMPGSFLHDFGDALRTTANPFYEDEPDSTSVHCDLDLLKAYCQGYLPCVKKIMNTDEIMGLPHAPAHMTFIIALRFLTDYLNDDIYFKIDHPQHNLQRAKAQFALYYDFKEREPEIEQIISQYVK
ncbi:MAG TPA: aminoglycoside phosphotransferase family protein [Bacteroidales bacterium]|jgi:Ser/Thr protein kinase RdoA (MazF antagonist)|nr:MAG: N-acetylhexosamine 1-kinase [Bacteroidetes bacterium ADurb.Bin012]HNQ58968.1 aminoglycoside phosphotransferase family protein [Bacteroidales bacterium]HNU21489.1 aminoglycoside phosphotransferase family protein [Bacteroidales bacterium]HNV16218.1 aminoglycoside phosphotransferase family protein [Bacteroidales bacterium]HNZ78463.1 aminoglycoside phosphotransferase family protein [Bacteroidales bacterium]